MKIIKPLRLSLLSKVYRYQGNYRLGVASIALIPLRGTASLLTEMELWRLVGEQLADVPMLDAAVPKACPEFLVSGHAYGRYCPPGRAEVEVGVTVAGLEKRLRVTGDRHWDGGRPTSPGPFEQMSLGWQNTYGGSACAENPLGKGHSPIAGVHPVPNLEPIDQYLDSPEQSGTPISLGAVDMTWPQRYRLADDYGQRWLDEDYPGYSRNIDWNYFNTAQPDQWFHGLDAIPSGAKYELHHLHPELACLRGELPPLQARCFIHRKEDLQFAVEEVPLRLTTLWFIPHCERAILIFHGSATCKTFDGDDINCILLGADDPSRKRSLEHYQNVLATRLAPKHGAMHALRDIDLLPAALIGPGLESTDTAATPTAALLQNMLHRAENERLQLIEHLASRRMAGSTRIPDLSEAMRLEPLTSPAPEDLPDFYEGRERVAKAAAEKLQEAMGELQKAKQLSEEQRSARADNAFKADRDVSRTRQIAPRKSRETDFEPSLSAQSGATSEHSTAPQALARSIGGHLLDAAPLLDPSSSRSLRAQIEDHLAQGKPLSKLALAGADLSEMDLRGADLSGADLESANLSACHLAGANLRGALLSRTQLQDANLEGCDLSYANLGKAKLQGAMLHGANLTRTCLDEAEVSQCNLRNARLVATRLKNARLCELDFTHAQLENLVLLDAAVTRLCLHGTRIVNLTFHRCQLQDVDFSRSQIKGLAMIETEAIQGISFQGARIRKSCFIGQSNLSGADFSGCEMDEVCLRGTRLEGADFPFSRLRQTDLSNTDLRHSRLEYADLDGSLLIRADLRNASLQGASLMSVMLQGADLRSANLSLSNLFRASLGEVRLDDRSRLEHSHQQRANWRPAPIRDERSGGDA
jgi:uncharacterized protein YjbI with pentapeptide repeats